MNKLTTAIIASSLLLTSSVPAFATVEETPKVDQCDQENWVEVKKDYEDSRISIDFKAYTTKINIEPKDGYTITKVLLKVDSYEQSAYTDYTSNFPGEFDPPGYFIKYAKVTTTKTCTEVCTLEGATNKGEVVEGQTTANDELCLFPEEPVATPSATPEAPTQLPMTGFAVLGLLGLGIIGTASGISLYQAKRFFKKEG